MERKEIKNAEGLVVGVMEQVDGQWVQVDEAKKKDTRTPAEQKGALKAIHSIREKIDGLRDKLLIVKRKKVLNEKEKTLIDKMDKNLDRAATIAYNYVGDGKGL